MNRTRSGRGRSGACLATETEAKRFAKDGASSPAPQLPKFLKGKPKRGELYSPKQDITIRLKEMIDEHAYHAAFESAIRNVQRHRLEELKAIHTLDQFYFYLDKLVTWVPGLRVWEWQGTVYHERTDYLRLTQFYFYFNQPELEGLQSPIDPVEGTKLTPLSRWIRDFAVELGSFMDDKDSIGYLETYKYGPAYGYQDYEGGKNGLDGYKTFNDWFSRKFKDIDTQRPVAQPDNDRVISFPAESTFVGQWAISTPVPEGQPLPQRSSIVVKHVEWPIAELLSDSEYADDFEGGLFMHSFLNIYDYHRQHAPASGKILEAKFIPGQAYLEVDLDILDKEERVNENSALAYAVSQRRYLDAEDSTGYQFIQCRGMMILETAVGKIAVLPMGMGYVSSVVFATAASDGPQKLIRLSEKEKQGLSYEEQVELVNDKVAKALVNKTVKKGDMISSFLFGGSDIVMVFERKSSITITAKAGVHYPIRTQLAVSNIAELAKF